ncbi:1-deoxy-D-xylulose-5-phosphate reductoisomerase [Thermoproteota archaeon]
MMSKKKLTILGSTGSIGVQTLDVVSCYPENFEVHGLCAEKNSDLLIQQINRFKPKYIAVSDTRKGKIIQDFVHDQGLHITVFSGSEAMEKIVAEEKVDMLVAAVPGTKALKPVIQAVQAGITIALASKEVLVSAGKLIMQSATDNGVQILPIDSEHAALKQCLEGINEDTSLVHTVYLTASGGPFWEIPKKDFSNITCTQALKHPTWKMGTKVTIDSSTMINKGFEVIEAHHLFAIPFNKIKAVIHPQSIIHSLVEFTDGNMLAQLNLPDMRFPIQYALTYPEKWENDRPKLELTRFSGLEFFPIESDKFPLFEVACEAGRKGGTYPVVMNAANEVGVTLFLQGKLKFMDIPVLVQQALETADHDSNPDLDSIIELDRRTQEKITNAYT